MGYCHTFKIQQERTKYRKTFVEHFILLAGKKKKKRERETKIERQKKKEKKSACEFDEYILDNQALFMITHNIKTNTGNG